MELYVFIYEQMYVFACIYVCTDVNRENYMNTLYEHIQAEQLSGCGICGEMFNARHEATSCLFSHLFYITDGEGES